MTTLIYRAVSHTPSPRAMRTPRQPKNLVYRGVAHDGLARRSVVTAALMTYRGIDYVLSASGERIPLELAVGEIVSV